MVESGRVSGKGRILASIEKLSRRVPKNGRICVSTEKLLNPGEYREKVLFSPGSTIFRYSHRFDPFPVLPCADCRYSDGFYLFSVLARILPFSVLVRILPIFGTHRDSLSILPQIVPFPGTCPDSTIFRYSQRFNPFPVLVGTVFRYSHGMPI